MSKIDYEKLIISLIESKSSQISDALKTALKEQNLSYSTEEHIIKEVKQKEEIKPKFKVGDSITDGNKVWTVYHVDDVRHRYCLMMEKHRRNCAFSYIERNWRLAVDE